MFHAVKFIENMEAILPDPRGKKSFPTTLSSTDDFPELYNTLKRWDDKCIVCEKDEKYVQNAVYTSQMPHNINLPNFKNR